MGGLAEDLMAMFALALDLPELFFADKIDRHISRLRVRNYPAPTAPPKPGQLRAGAHCDYGSLTILRTEDKPGGLQVFNHAKEWVDVPFAPDSFIINIGELMARWTNERWRANLHRVVNPPADKAAASRRLSLVFFHNPNYDTPVAALPGTTRRRDAEISAHDLGRAFAEAIRPHAGVNDGGLKAGCIWVESVWLLLGSGRSGFGFPWTVAISPRNAPFHWPYWISLDFLGFSRPNRDFSMGCAGFSAKKNFSRPLWRRRGAGTGASGPGVQRIGHGDRA